MPTDWKTLVNGWCGRPVPHDRLGLDQPAAMKVAGFSESYIASKSFPFTTQTKRVDFDGYDSINQPGVKVATTLGHDL